MKVKSAVGVAALFNDRYPLKEGIYLLMLMIKGIQAFLQCTHQIITDYW